MRNEAETTEAGRETDAARQYAAAYAAHYTERDLPGALRLYVNVIASHPDEQEANFSRAQVQNIVNAVVPKQELFDAQVNLAAAYFAHEGLST
jgi:hypothetical protein